METAPLKSFATSARIELIREVTARITTVLAQGSPERVEQPRTVAALEKVIATAGGGDKGKAHMADKVAYIWFNRIIALRFMDANGYTGIGVVSPATDQVGQPEVLAAAKRGQVDRDVVSKDEDIATITGLLNGTRQPRPGVDAQAEAYALLLADYCRHWNKAMSFMFEREGDFTELLIPANLLADDSVLNRSVKVLTEDVCQDVEVIGWLYQFYISERKDEVFAGFKKNKKAGAGEIPAATQLFTPHWIVRYLVENSLGRLWMLNRPSSGLASQMDYYIAPADEETDFLKINKPEELKVIDPACGSGHMLTYAFDLLYAIYDEEGYAPSEISGLILANNLYGTEIDPRAGALAAFALTMKARAKQRTFFNKRAEPNVCVIEPISFGSDELEFLVTRSGDRHAEIAFWNQFAEADTFGALIQPDSRLIAPLARHVETFDNDGELLKADTIEWARRVIVQAEYLSSRYSVVVANPPYMGSKQMNDMLSQYLKHRFREGKSDLFAAFILRGLSLVRNLGFVAQVTMQSWMVLSSYEDLRSTLRRSTATESVMHMGNMVMRIAFGTSATVWRVGGAQSSLGSYFYVEMGDLGTDGIPDHIPPRNPRNSTAGETLRFVRNGDDFEAVPGAPIAYWLSDAMRAVFTKGKPLSKVAEPRQGMATADNARFVRQWWEVSVRRCGFGYESRWEAKSTGSRWFPYTDGGEFRRWFGNRHAVVNWENDGEELRAFERSVVRNPDLYFRESVTWSAVGSGVPAFRYTPTGSLFSNAGMSFFAASDTLESAAAICNSTTGERLFAAIAPTLNLGVGEIGKLPIVDSSAGGAPIVGSLVKCARSDWDDFETSWDFARPSLLTGRGTSMVLREHVDTWASSWREISLEQQRLESENNRTVAEAYGVEDEVLIDVPLHRVSLSRNVEFAYGYGRTTEAYVSLQRADAMRDLVSYAVGCMLGRYSLDESGLILANQGANLQDYLAKVPAPTFTPDADNVIPIVDGDWFEDDIVERLRQFLRVAFGEQHFEENLRFVTESLGVTVLREYFAKRGSKMATSRFYEDHVQRYKKRPIYWMFSSPKGSFNALIYMHRYTPSTVSTVLTYLREYVTKLESSLQQAERAGNAKEADRLRKIVVELNEYEHDTLYPKASENIAIDLDDGVKVNYPKFGAALKKIVGLESSNE